MTVGSPSIPKVNPPRLSNAVERERLYARLDGPRFLQVTWLHGVAGAGKTTLLAGYTRSRGLLTVWYRLDERDEDPATFFHYFPLALMRRSVHSRGRSPRRLPGPVRLGHG